VEICAGKSVAEFKRRSPGKASAAARNGVLTGRMLIRAGVDRPERAREITMDQVAAGRLS